MQTYYNQRAKEFEKVYHIPERQEELSALKAELKGSFSDLRILEIACGTGYWTQVLAESAQYILASDQSVETLEVAESKKISQSKALFVQDDAYSLEKAQGTFNAAFAGFWWSHIPKRKLSEFLMLLHSKLTTGSKIVFIDNEYQEGISTPLKRTDHEGNTYQIRTLNDGSQHEVLKNFPTDEEIQNVLRGIGKEIKIVRGTSYWRLEYRYEISDSAKIHDEKYRAAKSAGLPGWGGADRVSKLSQMLDERFFAFGGAPRGGKLLELGCGAGNLSIELAKKGFEVHGVDFSESAIAWAKENAEQANHDIGFNVGDVTSLPFYAENTFDVVYDGNCFHCILGEKRSLALSEWKRVLKPTGMLFVSSLCAADEDPSFPKEFNSSTRILSESGVAYRFIPTPEMIVSELQEAGFKILNKFVRSQSPFGHINIHAIHAD
ncbi:methyltransferase domain-containing protein [Bdellovibrio sp. HCB337]|uniref:methyltransferase domain-containing protein n=1 Tax=Bdellovibrio sp. HCB337 TaxID=3394358 RepID=UPI0039A68995